MWFSSWWPNRTVSRKQRPATRFRPTLELLEDRAVPATLTVNTTLDLLGHDNGVLSLRQAVLDANARTTADTIVVPAGTYNLSAPGAGDRPACRQKGSGRGGCAAGRIAVDMLPENAEDFHASLKTSSRETRASKLTPAPRARGSQR